MNYQERILEIIKKNNGHITNTILRDNNIPTIYLTRLREKGIIEKVNRGVYIQSDVFEDEFYTMALKYSKIVFSKRTALYLNNLSNRTITKYDVNVPYNYAHKILGLEMHRVSKVLYETGISYVETPFGNKVKSYDAERCICDIFVFNEYDNEQIKFMIDEYIKNGINYDKLYRYAKVLKVYDQVRLIFEVR